MALRYILVAAFVFVCIEAFSTIRVSKRSLASNSSNNESTEIEICQGRTPCGWGVYNRITRYIDYFMKNKCECSKEKKCLRDEDDISITAYVYRCKIDNNTKNAS